LKSALAGREIAYGRVEWSTEKLGTRADAVSMHLIRCCTETFLTAASELIGLMPGGRIAHTVHSSSEASNARRMSLTARSAPDRSWIFPRCIAAAEPVGNESSVETLLCWSIFNSRAFESLTFGFRKCEEHSRKKGGGRDRIVPAHRKKIVMSELKWFRPRKPS